jgi:DNA polymerase I-like protein with 3'-5' exonuclease and polymerase domains
LCKRWYVTIVEDLQASGYTKEEVAIVAFVHDEVQVQVKKGLEEKVGELIIKAMHKTEDYYKFRCPLDSEYSFGESWADTH